MFQQKSQKRVLFPRTLAPAMVGGFLACLVLFSILFSLFGTPRAAAATNGTLNFQARLENTSGSIAADGNYNVQFKLYNVSSGGSALWTETYQNSNSQGVAVKDGYLSTSLGSITAFPGTINWDQDLWVTLNIGGTGTGASPTYDGEMNPRLHLTSVPYAFRAGQLAQFNSGNGFTSTLSLIQPTSGNQAFQIPDQGVAGTYNLCIANSSVCGFALSSGNTNYIQNQIASAQTSTNFWISGTGRAATSLQAPLIDAATASTALDIGTTNANQINLNQNVTVANNKTFTAGGNVLLEAATASQTAFQISSTSSTPIVTVDTTTTNLVSNSGFEPNITNWSAKGTATLSQTSSQLFSGSASLQAIVSAANSGVQTSAFTSALAINTQYELTFMASCSSTIGTFTYGRQDVSGTDINATTTANCDTNWRRYSFHFTTGGTLTSPNIFMNLGTTASGTFWIDAVQLTQTTLTGVQPYAPGSVKIGGVISDPVVIKNVFNSTNALEVQDTTGHSNTLVVDTVNNSVNVGALSVGGTANPVITAGRVLQNVTADTGILTSGTLGVARGGTGVNGSTAANGTLLIGNGSGYTLSTLTAGSGVTITNAAGGITIAAGGGPSGAASGDLTGSYPGPTIAKLQGGTLTITTATTNNILQYNGSAWVNQSISGDLTLSSTAVATISTGAITGTKIANNTITNTNLASGTFGNITGTGALTAGSIASGFGTISTSNTITGTTLNGTTGINTGSGAGTQRIDANGNLTNIGTIGASGKITTTGDMTTGNQNTISVTRTIPTTVGTEVDLGSFAFTNGGSNLYTDVTIPSSGFSVAKQYTIPVYWNGTGNAWQFVQPLADTGIYSGNDVTLEININSGTASLRLRRSAGTVAGTAYVTIRQQGVVSDVFTASTATAAVSAPTTYYNASIAGSSAGTFTIQGALNANSTSNSVFGNGTTGGIQIGDAAITKTSGGFFQFGSGGNFTNDIQINGSSVITSTRVLQNVTANANILTSGTIASGLLSGSYTGITAVGTLTSLTTSGVITSTVATGTAPLTVASTTVVTNLNADMVDGQHASAFASASGSGNYIQNQNAAPQATSNFWISGTGKADTLNAVTALQTNGINRIDASGNLSNIGTISASGALSVSTYGSNFGTYTSCCSTQAQTLGLSENTSSNNRQASLQFHNTGIDEAYIRLGRSSRTIEIGDDQGSGANIAQVVPTPSTPGLTASASGGTLATGTYYYKVTAVTSSGETVGSTEANVAVTGPTGSVQVTFTAVTGASSYRVYRGASSGAENTYYTTATSPFTDTGAAGTAASPPIYSNAYVNFFSTNGASYLQAGSLGIGTTTPGQKLDVQGGNINTSGSVMTGGTSRIDASGNLTNIANLTMSGTTIHRTFNKVIAGTAGWFKLGNIALPQDGYNATIKLYAGSGYNADPSQNSQVELNIRSGNSASTNASGFATSAIATRFGQNSNFASQIKLVGNAAGTSATSYDIYVNSGTFIGNGYYTVDAGSAGSWTESMTTTTDPGVDSSTVMNVPFEFLAQNMLYANGSGVGVGTKTLSGYILNVQGGNANLSGNLDIGATTVITSGRVLQNVTANANILTSGTIASGLLSGSYTGITAVGTLTSLTTSGVITSTVATGTAPLTVASTTVVTNLNADMVDGQHASAFASASGSGNYIQNQNAAPQATSNFWISGSGRADGGLLGPSIDVAAAGTLTIGGSLASTINIGANAAAHTIAIGTDGTQNQLISMGSTTAGSTLLLQGGAGASAAQIQVGSGGTIGIGNNAAQQNINIGNATGATTVSVICGTGSCGFGNNATAHATTVGSSSGTASTAINGGTNGITIGNNALANTIQIGNTTGAVAQTINIGNNGTASSTTAMVIGSLLGSSTTTINGANNISLATNNAAAGVIVKANIDSTTAFSVQAGSGVAVFNVDTTDANLLAALNPGFELSPLTSWVGRSAGGSVARSTTYAYTGSASGAVTTPAIANTGIQVPFTMAASTQYMFSFYARMSGGNSMSTLAYGRQDVSGTDIDCATGQSVSGNGWTRYTCSFTTGATITSSNLYIKQTDATARAGTLFVDSVQLETNTTNATAYGAGNVRLNASITSPISIRNTENSTTAFAIQNAAGTSLFTVDSLNGKVVIGSGTDRVEMSSSGRQYYGNARPILSLVSNAEYPNSVLDAQGDATCTTANNGTMTSGYDSTNRMNYYNWTSTSATSQCYDIVAQIFLPEGFDGWYFNPINLQATTDSTVNSSVSVQAVDSFGTIDTNYNYTTYTPTTSWSNIIPAGGFAGNTTWVGGNTITFKIRVTAKNGANVKIGKLALGYVSKY